CSGRAPGNGRPRGRRNQHPAHRPGRWPVERRSGRSMEHVFLLQRPGRQQLGCPGEAHESMNPDGSDGADDQLSLTFAALADPAGRPTPARLANGEATVNELAEPFSMSMQAVSKHLKVLEKAGLISRSRTAQWRPARLVVEPLESANDWIDRYREVASDRFNRLDQEIQRIKSQQSHQEGEHSNG